MGGLNCIGVVWTLLSAIATTLIVGGLLTPEWLVGRVSIEGSSLVAYFGAYKRCNYPIYDQSARRVALLSECGRYESFSAIPSVAWQGAVIFLTAGASLSTLLTLLLIPSICLNDVINRSTAIMVGLFQLLAVIAVFGSLILYAGGWNNSEVRDACGPSADKFSIGECHLGRAFLAVFIGGSLLIFCAILSVFGGRRKKTITDENMLIRGYENTRLDFAK